MSGPITERLRAYWDILHRFDDLVALESLREAGVFHALLSGSKDLETLAAETGTAAPRLRAFIDLVRHLGFLEVEGGRYRLVAGDEAIFDPEGPVRGNPGVPDLQTYLERRGSAPRVLRSNEPLSSPATGGASSAEARREFLQHVHEVSQEVADEVAVLLSRFHPETFADLGCGPGTYTVSVLRKCPGATALLVDRENAAEFVEHLCAEAGLADRTEFRAMDITTDDLGTDFDLILLSENIHNFGASQNRQFLENVARSLRPGGRVAIKDTRVLVERSGPLEALRFAYALAIFSPHGTLYTEAEVIELLAQAGLQHEQTLRMELRPDSYLVIGRKPG